jgi:excisionase family DNA binding protein
VEVSGVQRERLLTVTEIAKQVAAYQETVHRWVRAGRFKGFRLGID